MNDELRMMMSEMGLNPKAENDVVSKTQQALGVDFPDDYTEFLKLHDGGEGPIGTASYLVLWSTSSIPESNLMFKVPVFAPGIVVFGSDGGDNAYGFDMRSEKVKYIKIPFVGMSHDQIQYCGDTFLDFIKQFD